jgi:hypothetical protein
VKIETFKAQGFREEHTDSLEIVADQPFPTVKTLEEAASLHTLKGRELAQALVDTLPGGTVDAVLRHLLEHRASLLAVRWDA